MSTAGAIVTSGNSNGLVNSNMSTYHQHNQQATHHSLPNAYNVSFHHHRHHHHQYSMSGAVSSASSSSSSSSVSSNSSSINANLYMNGLAPQQHPQQQQAQPQQQQQQQPHGLIQTGSSVINTTSSNSNSIQVPTNPTSQSTNKQTVLNHATIKLLKRLLDEASQTGDLNLANRNLNEFPSKLALNYDLSDTLTADLSKNHLTEFPKDLCAYDSLERLTLYANLIRQVPDIQSSQLCCLKVLDLNSNNLSYLPPSICNLNALQVLTVNNNKLVSLPEEIGRLKQLIQLVNF
jgi:Leucine-rich repeat (LRR) protein